jgi:hypothetical protein
LEHKQQPAHPVALREQAWSPATKKKERRWAAKEETFGMTRPGNWGWERRRESMRRGKIERFRKGVREREEGKQGV